MAEIRSAITRMGTLINRVRLGPVLIAWVLGAIAFWFFHELPSALRWPARLLFLAMAGSCVLGIWRMARGIRRQPRRSLFVFAAVAIGIGFPYLCLEALCWGYLRMNAGGRGPFVLTETQAKAAESIIAGEGDYTRQSRELGWTTIPGATSSAVPPAKANMQGLRATREYPTAKPPGVVRALCFGDSFTHCNDVADDETWPHYAEETGGMEFLNFGVGGYGMTQALLRYLHDGRAFETDVVVLGCMTSDIRRSVNAYYPFRFDNPSDAPSPMGIPYASLDEGGNLVLHPNPLPDADAYRELLANPGQRLRELAELDVLFQWPPPTPLLTVIRSKVGDEFAERWSDISLRLRRNLNSVLKRKDVRIARKSRLRADNVFSPDHPVFKVNCAVFDRFVSDVRATGAHPVILWFPRQQDVARRRDGRALIYQPFLDDFASKGYDFVDTLDWIAADMQGDEGIAADEVLFIGSDGHFTPATNRVIGRRIAEHVRKAVPDDSR